MVSKEDYPLEACRLATAYNTKLGIGKPVSISQFVSGSEVWPAGWLTDPTLYGLTSIRFPPWDIHLEPCEGVTVDMLAWTIHLTSDLFMI